MNSIDPGEKFIHRHTRLCGVAGLAAGNAVGRHVVLVGIRSIYAIVRDGVLVLGERHGLQGTTVMTGSMHECLKLLSGQIPDYAAFLCISLVVPEDRCRSRESGLLLHSIGSLPCPYAATAMRLSRHQVSSLDGSGCSAGALALVHAHGRLANALALQKSDDLPLAKCTSWNQLFPWCTHVPKIESLKSSPRIY